MTEAEKIMLEEMMVGANNHVNKQAAEMLFAMYTAYKKAGFTASQAFSLVKGVLTTAVDATIRSQRGSR